MTGPGQATLAVSRVAGAGSFRIFTINADKTVTITGLTMSNGSTSLEDGGGILNHGTLSLTNVTVRNNLAYRGGGIFSDGGNLTINTSTISQNTSNGPGGGIGFTSAAGQATIANTEISSNNAFNSGATDWGLGGGIYVAGGQLTVSGNLSLITNNMGLKGLGIYNQTGATLTVSGATISGNHKDPLNGNVGYGGGIYNNGSLTVSNNATITNNDIDRVNGFGGGIYNDSNGTATITSTTISANKAFHGGGFYLNRV